MAQFGTSGLRGLATDLTDELCATYAAAFVTLHAHNGRIFVGQDNRDSSPRIAHAVAAGAISQGLDVVDCGVLPTPALAGAALAEGTLSIMVTGSHIPADRNGLKFYTRQGEFTKADEAPLREAVAGWDGSARGLSVTTSPHDATAAYVARYVDGMPDDALSGQRIGMWVHSSSAAAAIPAILDGLGAEVVLLGPSDSFVPVDTEAVAPEARAQLKAWVAEQGLAAIVSTDGDADRPLMIDDQGEVVPGDILGPITARWIGADDVVTTVSANTVVDLMQAFERVARTKIGSPYVIAEMEARAPGTKVAGYEPNGGFLLGWDVGGHVSLPKLMTRDCALPLIATLAAAAEAGGALSDLVASVPARRTATDRLQDIPRAASLALVEAILGGDHTALPEGLGALISTDQTDGVRLTFDTGRILHIRPSGNAPELRCYVEAEDNAVAEAVLRNTLSNLRAFL
ncbi:MAG: phosphomannomutase [Pseudomonadota bacterium]